MSMRLGPSVASADEVNVKGFGAVGDGVADDTAAIQGAIDFAIQNGIHKIYIPQGTYRTTNTIHIGYGVGVSTFYTFTVYGAGRAYNGEGTGTLILATALDRPAIAIQGVRATTLSDMTVAGQNWEWITTGNPWGGLGDLTGANSLIEAVGSNWIDPDIASAYPNWDSQHAPYAGIAIDPYTGAQPVDHYPDVTYPAWLGGGIPQYNKAMSSILEFQRLEINGFGTGIVCQPSGDGNGDFWGLHDCRISACKWGLSVGNTQAHNIHATKTMFYLLYCGVTNYAHGTKNGSLDGLFSECYFGDSYQMFQLNTTYSGPVVFEACYAELLTRLGDTYGNTPWSPVTLRGCRWFLGNGGTGQKFVPANYVTSSGAPILLEGCYIWCSRGFFYNATRLEVKQCYKYPASGAPDNWGSTLAHRRCINASLGEFPTIGLQNSDYYRGEHSMVGVPCYNDDSVASETHRSSGNAASDRYLYGWRGSTQDWLCSRGNCIPWATALRRGSESMGSSIILIETMPAFSFVSGINWTVDFTVFFARGEPCNTWGVGVGDCITCNDTGWRFVVTGINGNTVNLEQLNGYYTEGGVLVSAIGGSIPISGFISIFNSRLYTFASFGLIGDFTSGSNTITNVQRSNGDGWVVFAISASPTYNQIHVGDYMLSQTGNATQSVESYPLYSVPHAGVQVTGTGANTITLAANAANTSAHVPINFWCKVD